MTERKFIIVAIANEQEKAMLMEMLGECFAFPDIEGDSDLNLAFERITSLEADAILYKG